MPLLGKINSVLILLAFQSLVTMNPYCQFLKTSVIMQVSTAITFNFIWDNKMAKIKKRNHTIIGELKNGGLNMIDSTQFISCIKRFHLTENTA